MISKRSLKNVLETCTASISIPRKAQRVQESSRAAGAKALAQAKESTAQFQLTRKKKKRKNTNCPTRKMPEGSVRLPIKKTCSGELCS
jgi:hypothetical protein